MQEYIKNAAGGWERFHTDGKYAVLLLGALLFLWYAWLVRRQGRERELVKERTGAGMQFLLFTTLTAALAAVPVTAALLMIYQTKFYDYEWIWAIVPMTAMTAYGMTVVYTGCYEKYWKGRLLKPAAFAALGLAVLILCGNLQGSWYRSYNRSAMEEETRKILDDIMQNGNNKNICMWAPREIMNGVRAVNGEVKLLYGRNMWEEALNAYSYDVYEPELSKLYEWMESAAGAEKTPETIADSTRAAAECVKTALNYGVNMILLPDSAAQETKDSVRQAMEDGTLAVTQYHSQGYIVYSIGHGDSAG